LHDLPGPEPSSPRRGDCAEFEAGAMVGNGDGNIVEAVGNVPGDGVDDLGARRMAAA